VRQTSSDTLGTEQWVMQDTINYLARDPTLGPQAYTDDNDGALIEERVVRDRVSYSTDAQKYDEPTIANDNTPSVANDNTPSIVKEATYPMPYSATPSIANYAPIPFENYPIDARPNYPIYPSPNYPVYPPPNYPIYHSPNYPIYTPTNYPVYPPPNYPIYPSPNYPIYPSIAPYSPFRPQASTRKLCDNEDRRQGLWERIFLKP